jgi:hypothetical protein
MGFSRRWINWISILLSTANTKILLNGHPGRICHARGLRQGDPLSLLLFVLAMEGLNSFFKMAKAKGIFSSLQAPAVWHRLSLYADDLVLFLAPTTQDIMLVKAVLEAFAGTSGLRTNFSKCHFTPIRCSQFEVDLMQRLFPCQLSQFPCKYLGIPLSVHKLKKADFQPLIDAVADWLPTRKAGLMARAGRTTVVKAVLTAIPIHVAIAVGIAPPIYKAIDRLRRAFIWTGSASANGGCCMVAWPRVARPQELGGLGVLDLVTLGYTLRLRWAWLEQTDTDRPWISLPSKHDKIIQAMFEASVTVQVGNGARTLFWTDRWLDGAAIANTAPDLFSAVHKNAWKNRLVSEAIPNGQWIRDITGSLSATAIRQYVCLWSKLNGMQLDTATPDRFVWKWISHHQYSASSTYRAFFIGQCGLPGAKELRKTKAPPACKFFMWLLLLGRCWTGERLV